MLKVQYWAPYLESLGPQGLLDFMNLDLYADEV